MGHKTKIQKAEQFAVLFTKTLMQRDYHNAYQMTAPSYQERTNFDEMVRQFETYVPRNWVLTGEIEAFDEGLTESDYTLAEWPDKQPGDIAHVYTPIPGTMYSEAVTPLVAEEDKELVIRDIVFGRP